MQEKKSFWYLSSHFECKTCVKCCVSSQQTVQTPQDSLLHLSRLYGNLGWVWYSSIKNIHYLDCYCGWDHYSVVTNLFFERIWIPNLIRNPEIFRIRIRILFVVRKFSNPNPNIRDSGKKIQIWIRIFEIHAKRFESESESEEIF